jgi:hypothetical protein
MKITRDEFDRQYDIVINQASGNCLFEAIAYSINILMLNTKDFDEEEELTHHVVRSQISDFYSEFDRDIEYPKFSIESAVILGLKYDNDDYDEFGQLISHDTNVKNDAVWGSMTDLLVCSILFDVDINLYKRFIQNDSHLFEVERISYQYKNKNAISILYNNVNHFESIIETIFHD